MSRKLAERKRNRDLKNNSSANISICLNDMIRSKSVNSNRVNNSNQSSVDLKQLVRRSLSSQRSRSASRERETVEKFNKQNFIKKGMLTDQ